MLHSRHNNQRFNSCNNSKIKHLHERYTRLIHNGKLLSYEELLEKDGSVSVYHRNIQSLPIGMFHIKHGQSVEIVTDIFTQATRQ